MSHEIERQNFFDTIGQRAEMIKRGTDLVIGWSPAAQEIVNRKREPVLVR